MNYGSPGAGGILHIAGELFPHGSATSISAMRLQPSQTSQG